MIGFAQVVHVVGAHEVQRQVLRHSRDAGVDDPLLLDPVPLHLEEEVLRTEDVAIRRRRRERSPVLPVRQPFGHFPFQTAAQANQALRVRGQQILVDARLVIEPLRIAGGHELDQIVIALEVFSEEHEVVLRRPRVAALVETAAGRNVHLAAENRVQPARARMVVEDHRREHVPVLGDREPRHLQPGRLIEHFVDAARAVEQRELGVQVQVDEFSHVSRRSTQKPQSPQRSRRGRRESKKRLRHEDVVRAFPAAARSGVREMAAVFSAALKNSSLMG